MFVKMTPNSRVTLLHVVKKKLEIFVKRKKEKKKLFVYVA